MSTIRQFEDADGARRIRVLHFVSTFAVKTDTKWLLQLMRRFDRNRFEVAIACFYEGGPMREKFERIGVRTFNLETPNAIDPRGPVRAGKLIARWRPDVVHTHLLRADLYAGIAAKAMKVGAIVTNAYAVGDFRRAKRRLTDPILDTATSRIPTRVIAVSEAVKTDCVLRMGIANGRVSVIHTGIEPIRTAEFSKQASEFRAICNAHPEIPLVVTVARLSYEKGIDTLLEAAGHLSRRGVDFRMAIVGDGPMRAELEEMASELGVLGRVYFVGFQSNVWPAIVAGDIFCIPSKSEGFPNVLLEAMSAGKAIVATKAGGITDAVEHGINGLLVDIGDADGLATGIERIVSDREMAVRLGAAGRSTVLRRYHARDVTMRYESLYEDLVLSGGVAHAGAFVGG